MRCGVNYPGANETGVVKTWIYARALTPARRQDSYGTGDQAGSLS